MMRILYADTGLRGLEGHLASSGIALPPAFRRLGHQVTVLGHCDLVPALQETTGAMPFFRAFTWGRWSDDPVAGWLLDFPEVVDQTVADLHLAWVEFGPFDLIYVNTARPAQFAAAGVWLKEAFPDRRGAPVVAVQLGADTGLKRSGPRDAPTFELRDPTTVLHRYATRWVGKEWIERLVLVAVNEIVAEEYSFLVDRPVKAVTTPEGLPTPRQRELRERLTIGLLGQQRIDKGYELLPDLIAQVLQDHTGVRFVVQHSDPTGGAQEDRTRMARVTEKLCELAARDPRVEMILQPVVGDAWFQLIDRCDIIALPYEPPRYASSYSAIFGEALASGAVIVAPSGTTISKELHDAGGVGTTFAEWTAPAVAAAVGAAVDRFDDLRTKAYQGGIAWRKLHGPDAYAAAIIDAAGLAGGVTKPVANGAGRLTRSRPLPAGFLKHTLLHDGSSIKSANEAGRRLKSPRLSSLIGKKAIGMGHGKFSFIVGRTIETSARRWDYSLTAQADTSELQKTLTKGQLAVELLIEVSSGAIGVAWLDRHQQLVSIERTIPAGPAAQRVFVLAPCERAHSLMLRNVAVHGRSVFTVRKFDVTTISLGR